jgi:hypothetical protein
VSYHHSVTFPESAEAPCSKGEGVFVRTEMSMPNKYGGESLAEGEPLTETQPTLRVTFRDVYHFILQAVKGDSATANTIFEDYLAGKLSEQLLSISRGCVSADQAGCSNGDIEEGWRRDKLTGWRGAGVTDDALTATGS